MIRSLLTLFAWWCAPFVVFAGGNALAEWREGRAIAADAAPALSQQAVEPASGLARPGFDHTIARNSK